MSGMVCEIPLRNRRKEIVAVALVDPIDYEWANQFRWHLGGSTPKYPTRRVPTGKVRPRQAALTLHRAIAELMGIADAPMIDHINRNTLDNRRCNLRPADARLNAQHRNNENVGRKRYLPDAEPRPCQKCSTIFTPRRKSPGRIYCSLVCQRASCLDYSAPAQARRSRARWNKCNA